MNKKPIDTHCHLFSAEYAIQETAAIARAYVTGHYPKTEAQPRGFRAGLGLVDEIQFAWQRLEDIVKWFLDLRCIANGYEANYKELATACANGLAEPKLEGLIVAPLMMDIYYVLAPPSSPPDAIQSSKRCIRVPEPPQPEQETEASEAAFDRFHKRVIELAAAAEQEIPGHRGYLTSGRPETISKQTIDDIFDSARTETPQRNFRGSANIGPELTRGFRSQIQSLIDLRNAHPGYVFPFFAVDPRRRGVLDLAFKGIPELNNGNPLVSNDGPFYGIKLYSRMGYRPADLPPELFQECLKRDLPIIVHTSHGGFPPGKKWSYAEYAEPDLWKTILEKPHHDKLRIDFAHYGNGKQEWIKPWKKQIQKLMSEYDNVYADLACYTSDTEVADAKEAWSNSPLLRERLLFGTDFVMSPLTPARSLEHYFAAFKKCFQQDLDKLMNDNPRRFLSPFLPINH